VIPKEFSRRATVDHERLLRALRRVSLLSNEKTKPVKIEFESKSMTLRSNTPEMGEAVEQIPAEYTSESMVMGFNARYMLDALAVITSEQINLELNDPLSPGVLCSSDQDQFFYVIMPMRV
jgi:DNA polymerase-3 subunit beta